MSPRGSRLSARPCSDPVATGRRPARDRECPTADLEATSARFLASSRVGPRVCLAVPSTAVTRETEGAIHVTQSTTAQHSSSVLAAIAAVVGLTLTMTGNAARGHGRQRAAAARTGPPRPTPRSTRSRRTRRRTTPTRPCNRAQKDYLEKHLARCFSVVRTALDHQITPAADPPPSALGPADIQDAYNLPDSGAGEVVGIVDAFGDSHAEADLAQFRSFYGLPPCTVANGCLTIVNQDGDTSPLPPDDPGWGLETSLDLDAVSAACPNCTIVLVQGDDNSLDNLGIAVDTAVVARREVRLQLLRRARRGPGRDRLRPLLRPPRRRGDRQHRRHRQRHQLAREQPEGGGRRRHDADLGHARRAAGPSRPGPTAAAAARRTSRSRTSSRASTPSATTARSPTSPRTPTRTPAWPSTTPSARAAGSRSAAPACRRRSRRRCTRWPATRSPAPTPTPTRTPTPATSSTSPPAPTAAAATCSARPGPAGTARPGWARRTASPRCPPARTARWPAP